MKKTILKSIEKRSKVMSIIVLGIFLLSLASCSSPRCGYMKHYNRDVRMGIAH